MMSVKGNKYHIMHEHYMKEMSSLLLTNANAAMAWQQKRTILTQQCLRVILNCSPSSLWADITPHIEKFTHRMQASGYQKKMRYDIIKSAITAYKKIKKEDNEGIRPMYRSRDYKRTERREDRRKRKKQWYRKQTDNEAALFVPATQN